MKSITFDFRLLRVMLDIKYKVFAFYLFVVSLGECKKPFILFGFAINEIYGFDENIYGIIITIGFWTLKLMERKEAD